MDFDGFLILMGDKNRETDIEIHYKDTFRAFSKDDDGGIVTSFDVDKIFTAYLAFTQAVYLQRN